MDSVSLKENQNNYMIVEHVDKLDRDVESFLADKLGNDYEKDVADVLLNDGQQYDYKKFIYFYFLFSWRFFIRACKYNNKKFNNEISFIYLKLKEDNIQLTQDYLMDNVCDFFYYITAWNIEYLSSTKTVSFIIDGKYSNDYVNIISKMKTLAPKVSVAVERCNLLCSKRFGYLVYGIEAEIFNQRISSLKDEMNNMYHSDIYKNIQSFTSGSEKLNQCIEEQQAFLFEIGEINKKLKQQKSNFNFVLLSKAFENLKKSKTRELYYAYVRFSLAIISLIVIPVYLYLTRGQHSITTYKDFFLYAPLITLEILSFYFMRLFYLELKNIKSQILQISMRLSLCEFIHSYVETKELSNKSENAWRAFETLIFSPIQASDDKIPAVLDGADVIAELAGKIIGRKSQT
ncbi:hypothetical protein [Pectobacterium carotovorum]|uniref:hypothetical protein n=1 Tax=Pectobacterium carotovorum TaxID=554 RepID=UPI003016E73B